MTRDHRRAPHPGLIVLVILKFFVAIVPDLVRHAPDVARAVPPPRVVADEALAGFDGADWSRAMERIADIPVGDAIDLIGSDPGDPE